ncbi:hypothetical protein TW80_01560 [Loktanella sp. S4079]|nr:hypothetical protein TW80_01560 [Loktanella sp. S4079]
MPPQVSEAFEFQSKACIDLGSPFMGQLMRLCATQEWPDCDVTQRIMQWRGDLSPRGQSVPLRLAGALHALRLMGNASLAAAYPPSSVDDAQLWKAVCAALINHGTTIMEWLDFAPQTNEVRRSAVLIAVGHWLSARYGLPIRTSELGASAGLNLQWDQYQLTIDGHHFGAADPILSLTPDWVGALPPHTPVDVISRAGVDINPLSLQTDALRLQAYLWPDQPERMQLTQSAITACNTPVDKADAIDWLRARLFHQTGTLHLIYSTVAWQYFPPDKQEQGEKIIREAGQSATQNAPVAWFQMETDGTTPGAALTLRLWPGDIRIACGRADFHGRWVHWTAQTEDMT